MHERIGLRYYSMMFIFYLLSRTLVSLLLKFEFWMKYELRPFYLTPAGRINLGQEIDSGEISELSLKIRILCLHGYIGILIFALANCSDRCSKLKQVRFCP